MHRFFFLLMIWILVEAYWIAPQPNIAIDDITQTRSAQQPCVEAMPRDTLVQTPELEILE
jgi:hypothetical protein